MTRFWIWAFLGLGALVAAYFGLARWSTAGSAIGFGGLHLAMHSLFGEEA